MISENWKPIKRGSKTWQLTSPNGKTRTVKNLSQFCREWGLNSSGFYAAYWNGSFKYRGWVIKQVVRDL